LLEGYREIAAAEPERCVLIDATADVDTVAAQIWAVLRARLSAAPARSVASPA
jgi:dTMP kinase